MAIVPERTINDMTSPDLNQQPLCIEYPDLEVNFELKSGLIHLLPTFRGLAGENPHRHLKEFHVVCSGMRPQGVTEEQIKLRAFPFSLADQAKDWLYFLPSGSVATWNDLKKRFFEKYFPASRATTIRKEISGIRQFAGESLFEYWGRFNELVKSCPHHQIPDHLLIQYFYEGLSSMDRKLIDAASGGALFNKTLTEERNLISIMASNTQQFGTRYDDPPRKSNEVSIAAFDDRLNELTSLVKKLAVERTQHVKACGICTSPQHVTDMCPTLQEGPTEHTEAIGEFFRTTAEENFQRPQYRPPMPPPSNPKQGTHLEDMMKSLISNTQQIQQNTQQQIQQLQQSVQQFQLSTQTSIQNLESQMSQLASSVSKLESQVEKNYKNTQTKIALSAGTLRRKIEKEVEIPQDQDDETKEDNPKVLVTRPPFPERFAKSKKDEEAKEILETFRKVEVNIPCSTLSNRYPATQGFSRNYAPAKVSSRGTNGAMCDLGASINVMPLTIFESLHVGPLKETGVVIQLADRSVVYPEGVLEDVLVQVNELVFPADFYVLDMREDNSPNSTSILLGRPFIKTARTKIDVHAGTLTMEFDGEIISFNIFDSMRYPSDIPTVLFVDAFDPFVQKFPAIDDKDYIKLALEESPVPMEEENMGVDPLVQVNAKFDGDSVFLAKINKDLTYGPRTYKNKAFHDKISSRKNSLMNIKVFIGPRYLRNHYIEEVDSKCPTYSS
ncbi:UNVERIFIED_CONTAM: hypothetical protein Sradi_2650200 [Sesamum radiatum]|uniref:Retrotransposon gag domain-containing protein n=1 Tax=Sesamum radiatum TaxID=300843 RepID=A0AAW2S5M3_SESRA